MEFTKLVKYGAASLFLVLVADGLVRGFSVPTTVISVVLVSVVCLFEAQLVKSERDKSEIRFKDMSEFYANQRTKLEDKFNERVNKLSDELAQHKLKHEQEVQKLKDAFGAQKLGQGLRR